MRLGTRGSALALAQARLVSRLLAAAWVPDLAPVDIDIVVLQTSGDRDGSAPATGDKSRWVAELERALLEGDIDLAVHSAKDVPGDLPAGLELLGCPARAAVEDVLCGSDSLARLAPGARVGTSSVRRVAQLRAQRPDLEVRELRGNVDTRLRRLADPAQRLDAIVLARAGLERLGRGGEAGGVLDPRRMVPAPGQGALALEGRADDERARSAAAAVGDPRSWAALRCERALARELDASCHTPLGAWASSGTEPGSLVLRAWVGEPDGSRWVWDELEGDAARPKELAHEVAERLRAVGAGEVLGRAQRAAAV